MMASNTKKMFVLKRDGRKEPVSIAPLAHLTSSSSHLTCLQVLFDKITARIEHLCELTPKLNPEFVDPVEVAQKVVSGIFPGVKTTELDNLAAETAAYMSTKHPDYGVLAARIAISNLQKQTLTSFSETMKLEHEYINPKTKEHSPLISDEFMDVVKQNAEVLDNAIKYERDFDYDFFGFKTLERSYLPKLNGVIVERPQHMLMRVAVGIHKNDITAAIETYPLRIVFS
jgi:Ribonucleotide reductase, all-alpha domain/ATP cone domain